MGSGPPGTLSLFLLSTMSPAFAFTLVLPMLALLAAAQEQVDPEQGPTSTERPTDGS